MKFHCESVEVCSHLGRTEVDLYGVEEVDLLVRDWMFTKYEAEFIQFLQEKGYQVTEE